MSAAMGFKNEFETAVVNEPSVFEPLKFYCTVVIRQSHVCSHGMEGTSNNLYFADPQASLCSHFFTCPRMSKV